MTTYIVKVRDKETYLWGGQDMGVPTDVPLVLALRVDELGETIELAIVTSHGKKTIGKLHPGQVFGIPLEGTSGVIAQCASADPDVACSLLLPQN